MGLDLLHACAHCGCDSIMHSPTCVQCAMRGRHCAAYVPGKPGEKLFILEITDEKVYLLSFGLWFAGLAMGVGVMGMQGPFRSSATIAYAVGVLLSGYFIFALKRLNEQ